MTDLDIFTLFSKVSLSLFSVQDKQIIKRMAPWGQRPC